MIKKKILIFAHYYYPDVASTAQILKDQAEGMTKDFDVTVICTVPSYNGMIVDSYKTQKYYFETINGVKVIRVRVPEFTKSNKISRIKNIITYFFRALNACYKSKEQDYIFTISQPPILGGVLGIWGKWIKKAKMIYCIQDFNPEQVIAIGYIKNKFLLGLMMQIDKFTCQHSNLVVTVGRDLVQTLEQRFKKKIIPNHIMINNWIDEREIYPLEPNHNKVQDFKARYHLSGKFVIMYSGNIGLYYDLENLIKVLNNLKDIKTADHREVVFAFVGEGAVLQKLKNYVLENRIENIVFIPYQKKSDLIYSLNAADVHWCVNAKGIKGVSCPSKFYGICGVQKPVLAVLESGSEVQMLIEESGCGLVSEPGDYLQVEQNIRRFIDMAEKPELAEMGIKGYTYLKMHLSKNISIEKYINAIKIL